MQRNKVLHKHTDFISKYSQGFFDVVNTMSRDGSAGSLTPLQRYFVQPGSITHGVVLQGVEVEPSNPHVFWSAAEDGTVRQYDARLPSDTQNVWESSNCLLSVKAVGPASPNRSIELKGISLNKVIMLTCTSCILSQVTNQSNVGIQPINRHKQYHRVSPCLC